MGWAGAGSWGSGFGWIPGRGLGLAAWTQPEGVSTPQLAGRVSGKKAAAAKEARDIFLPLVLRCTGRGDSGRRLNKLQRQAPVAAINADPRDRHETLRLQLPPPKSQCASTGHYPHRPSREPVQPAKARLPWSRDNFPGERMARLRLLQRHAGLCHCSLAPHPYPSLPPTWVSQSPQSSCFFNLVLCERRTDALKRPTRRGRSKSKAEPWELYKQGRERENYPSSLRSSGLKLHKQLDVPASVEYLNRQRIIPNSGGGLWEQDILIFPHFLFMWVYKCMLLGEILAV